MRPIPRIAILALLLSGVTASAQLSGPDDDEAVVRTWTATTGGGFEAKLLEYSEETVVLRRISDGRQFTIPLERLIKEDRAVVANIIREDERDTLLEEGPYATMIHDNFEPGEFENGMFFNIWGPKGLDPKGRYPLVTFLHTGAYSGSDNAQPLGESGAQVWLKQDGDTEDPCFLLVPQCPEGKPWVGAEFDKVHALIQDVVEYLPVDENRLYLTGNRTGGDAIWYALEKYPDTYAAAIIIGSDGNPAAAEKIKHVPVWLLGDKNESGPMGANMPAMFEALEAAGATSSKLSELELTGSLATAVWSDAEVPAWLLEQNRAPAKPPAKDAENDKN